MNEKKQFPMVMRVILAVFIASVSALWLAPNARAQSVALTSTTDSGDAISPGDIVEVGYEVSINDSVPSPIATTISVTNAVGQIMVGCPNGSSQTLTVNLTAQSYSVPANTATWASSDTVFLGSVTAPSNLCGGNQGTETSANFTANWGFSCQHNSPQEGCCHNVCIRFHHRHHHHGQEYVGQFCERHCVPPPACVTPYQKYPCCEKKQRTCGG